ncbi:hypothetical protein VTK73DRAFT_4556 [Phialemonium thermophilum]|uniref:Uncharacterized protein n=1 Tax=Phialemonium thermophilum TaxID=223376 RepID=A0ABR3V8Q1_9PEZI
MMHEFYCLSLDELGLLFYGGALERSCESVFSVFLLGYIRVFMFFLFPFGPGYGIDSTQHTPLVLQQNCRLNG